MDKDRFIERLKQIYSRIDRLKEGQLIEVVWLDASTSRDVTRLNKYVIETIKRSIGYFITAKYNYLVMYFEVTDEKVYEILSIPIPCIIKITVFEARDMEGFKRGKKTVKVEPELRYIQLSPRGVKEVRIFGREEVI